LKGKYKKSKIRKNMWWLRTSIVSEVKRATSDLLTPNRGVNGKQRIWIEPL